MTRIHSPRHVCRTAARAAAARAQFANPGLPSPYGFAPSRRPTPVEALEARVLLAMITVTTTADDGPGSLRQAILDANATPTIPDTIRFNIPGTGVPPAPGVRTIRPLSPLPLVVGPTAIDAKTQPGSATRPMVELDGSAAGPLADGIVFGDRSYSNLVRGLVINRFSRHGIVVDTGAELTQIEFNYIGTDATGQIDLGNGGSGVVALGKAIVGGTRTAEADPGNVISGNEFAGVWVNLPGWHVDLYGNRIGTDVSGTRAIGNGREGVLVVAGSVNAGRAPGTPAASPNVISGNGASGIHIIAGRQDPTSSIAANFIGTDVTGSRAIPNGTSNATPYRDGVTVESQSFVRVGGPAGYRNVISGNVGNGVSIRGGSNLFVLGNYIGTDATGDADVGNGGHGVLATGFSTMLDVHGNVISGNGGDGVHAQGGTTTKPVVTIGGNRIGTNAAGTGAVGNDGAGVDLEGTLYGTLGGPGLQPTPPPGTVQPLDPASTGRNLISGNGGSGVVLYAQAQAATVKVQGNYIGTDFSGEGRLGNRGDGITVDRVTAAAPIVGNLVSGNGGDGIRISGSTGMTTSGSSIAGNYIGTNAAGTAPLGNGANGIELAGSGQFAIGGQPRGGAVTPLIDPAGAGRNVISANGGHGILIADGVAGAPFGERAIVRYNYIGTDVSGTIGMGNGGSGVYTNVGGSRIGEGVLGTGTNTTGNVISANAGDGVTIVGASTGNVIFANKIGTNAAGSDSVASLGNRGHGVAIYNSAANRIGINTGAVKAADGNVIAFNGRSGVAVEGGAAGSSTDAGPADGNAISGNSIFSNGGLGIDLVNGYEGVTPNDPRDFDTGPNRLQNFPVLTQALATSASTTSVRFTLNSESSRPYRIDFYSNAQADSTGFGEGKTYLGSTEVTTDSSGNFTGSAALAAGVPVGTPVTATATPVSVSPGVGSTSEFSAALRVGAPSVAGRYVFYNRSAFDKGIPGATADDDLAIATDKSALLPGSGPATASNYTSYSNGINGVMIDVLGLPLTTQLAAGDFTFRVGRPRPDGTLAWSAGPAPLVYNIRRGAGANGSDRVTLIWSDYFRDPNPSPAMAVANGWLEVTLRSGTRTGLARPDVFSFGNLVGETDGDALPARVTAADLAAIKRAIGSPRGVANRFDVNRDGLVNALDVVAARANLYAMLPPITAPLALAAPGEVAGPTPLGLAPVLADGTGGSVEGVWARLAT